MIEAAETIGWLRSALCSQFKIMFFGLFSSLCTSVVQDWMFTEGQSIITLIFSFRFLVSVFIIFAAFSASRRFRFLWLSISFGVESSMWYLYFSFMMSPIFFLWVGVRSFESFAPSFFIFVSSFSSIRMPARIIGPRTGPLPASSIPRSFIKYKEEKAL